MDDNDPFGFGNLPPLFSLSSQQEPWQKYSFTDPFSPPPAATSVAPQDIQPHVVKAKPRTAESDIDIEGYDTEEQKSIGKRGKKQQECLPKRRHVKVPDSEESDQEEGTPHPHAITASKIRQKKIKKLETALHILMTRIDSIKNSSHYTNVPAIQESVDDLIEELDSICPITSIALTQNNNFLEDAIKQQFTTRRKMHREAKLSEKSMFGKTIGVKLSLLTSAIQKANITFKLIDEILRREDKPIQDLSIDSRVAEAQRTLVNEYLQKIYTITSQAGRDLNIPLGESIKPV